MKLKQISRLLVQFSPWSGTARSARELVARATSAPARASNPDCEVETRVR
jgi:large subunit ribosomal protein L53